MVAASVRNPKYSMKMRTLPVIAIATCLATNALAHSDLEKPLYVAPDGVDNGRCHDPGSPCRTIGYALTVVGKGGQIRVAGGRYGIEDVQDVFHLVSGVVNVQGGYRRDDDFQEPTRNLSTLTGVPPEYRERLAAMGFNIVADRKSVESPTYEKTQQLMAQKASLQAGLKPDPCVGGSVGGMACDSVDLLAHLPLSSVSAQPGWAADVWGFVDLNSSREYVIVGFRTGSAVFDVTDPENPREVGFVDGQASVWRDIKVHQAWNAAESRWDAYAYVTTDGSGDGLFVIDLTDLPHRISRVSYASDFSAAHNVFAANTDYGTGLSLTGDVPTLIIAGSNNGSGRFRTYSLSDPAAPGFTTMPGAAEYMHDAASMIITDSRKDTQCVNAAAFCEVLFDFNESTVDIWDITVASNPVRLSRTNYPNSGYTHSGWPSEDKQFLFVHDELDEQNLGLPTTLRTLSLANLSAPTLANTWSAAATQRAIDHNGFVRGNRYYMSNYSRGLTILDIADAAAPTPIGHFDTSMFADSSASFAGAWGVYPFLHSGNIAVADIEEGLYLLADRTLDVAQGTISLTQASYGAEEGQSVQIGLQRVGGSSGAVSVALEIVPATADSTDIAPLTGSVSWADGDTADKSFGIALQNDGTNEGLEQFLVRSIAPTGGATITGTTVANVYVSDPGSAATVEFDITTINIAERGFATAVAVLKRSGSPTGAVSVDYALAGGDATPGTDFQGATTGTVTWFDGDANPRWIEFPVVDDGVGENDEFFEVALSNASGAALGTKTLLRVNIADGTGSTRPPNAVAGASQTVSPGATVTLDGNQSNDPDGDTLGYQWTQTMGPAVTLADPTAAVTTFAAPDVTSSTLLRFDLTVTDPLGLADTATTSVTVTQAGDSGGGLGSSGGGSLGFLTLAMLLLLGLSRDHAPGRALTNCG
jgi:choice-of-anchor B domain-containing protein